MEEIAPGVVRVPTSFVNAYLVGEPGGPWTLVDAGLPGFAWKIRAAAAERFGPQSRPEAIVLTHGHFDHSGGACTLADTWGTPIYAHRLELPYLTGRSDYPPPDPTIGGCIAQMSRVLPYGAMDFGIRLRELSGDPTHHGPADNGPVPGLPDWRWLHTPGHSPGHIAFFRESDRTLLAGDALATMNMDSYRGMLTKRRELSPAGSPFICDWTQASRSVETLAALRPTTLGCGHGLPVQGSGLAGELEDFSRLFAPPAYGRYVAEPALTDERGVDWLPPRPPDPLPKVALMLAAGGLAFMAARRRRD
jgi:glyoxylase-like metal-dependent hydrolase (beta-lactamase superfamily II)